MFYMSFVHCTLYIVPLYIVPLNLYTLYLCTFIHLYLYTFVHCTLYICTFIHCTFVPLYIVPLYLYILYLCTYVPLYIVHLYLYTTHSHGSNLQLPRTAYNLDINLDCITHSVEQVQIWFHTSALLDKQLFTDCSLGHLVIGCYGNVVLTSSAGWKGCGGRG